MSSSTPRAELTAAEAGLGVLRNQQASVGASLTNAEKAPTLKGAHLSAAAGSQRLKTAGGTLTGVLSNVQAALGAINAPSTPLPSMPAWALIFEDIFPGTVLSSNWQDHNGWKNQNNVTDNANNVIVNDGLSLILSDQQTGAAIESTDAVFAVGCYAEASIWFPSNGQTICNWPAWWTSGPNWPAGGENDIAEAWLGALQVAYHWQRANGSEGSSGGTIPGTWANGYHTYGIYRGSSFAVVYWDGLPVTTYPTDDDGAPQNLILTQGLISGASASETLTGAASAMKVQYVRVWSP